MDCVPSLELRVKPYALTWRASLSICLAVLLINLGTQLWSYGSLQNLNFLWVVLLLMLLQALTSQFGWTGRPKLVFAAQQLQEIEQRLMQHLTSLRTNPSPSHS